MADYFVISDVGQNYSWIQERTTKEQKAGYVDRFLGKVPVKLKDLIVSSDPSPYFSPTNGDVGTLQGIAGNKVILDVGGNLVLIGKKGVRKVSGDDYLKFEQKILNFADENFGFKLGNTSFIEAVSILKNANAKFDEKYSYKNYSDIRYIRVDDYKLIPFIKGTFPKQFWLGFIDDKLYEISLYWNQQTSNGYDDLRNFLIDTLEKKYNRNRNFEFVGKIHKDKFWLNRTRHIVLSIGDQPQSDEFVELVYKDTALYDEVENRKKTIDDLVQKAEHEKKNTEVDNAAKQL